MNCPECGSKAGAIDSRNNGEITYRRFECRKCKSRFTTIEQIVPDGIGLATYKKNKTKCENATKEQIDKMRAAIAELERICNEF